MGSDTVAGNGGADRWRRLEVILKPCLQFGLRADSGVFGDSPNVCIVTQKCTLMSFELFMI